ncbi:hypothetical protein UlMin_010107 [Ulmus minor]
MEELRQIALTYHSAATKEVKDMVEEFYKEMDPKDNGYVKFKEFSAYMETNRRQDLSSEEFFDKLKQPGYEELYIEDVITLFYIINSKRPFCGGKCREFVPGMYFTCVKCFDGSGSTFSVCPRCFDGEQYKHEHKEFLDPMVILHLKRELAINQKSSTSRDDESEEEPRGSSTTTLTPTSKRPKYERSTSSATTVVMNSLPASPASSSSSSNDKPDMSSSISNSIVPAVKQRSKQAKMQTAIQFGQLVASIGSIVVASQLCTIM